jgi:O-antigen/teichoic acid export membrane protein
MAQAASTAGGGGSLWKSAVSTLGTRAIDIPSRYGFHLLIAGKLGVIDAGAFYIVFSVITLVAGAGRLGIDRALTREVARLQALGDIAGLRRSVRAGLLTITGFSAAAAILLALSSPFLARFLFGNPALQVPLLLSAATLVPLCLSAGAAGALAGLHRVATSQMIYSWLWPALFCLLALPLRLDVERVMLLILCSTTFAALLSFALLWRFMPKSGAAGGETGRPRLIALGWSLFTTEIVQLLVAAMPALVLGMLADQAAVGAYSIAWRLALILNLLVVAVAAMASPRFADQAARGDQEGIRQTASKSVGLVLAAGILPLVVLWIGAPFFLSLFGSGFVSGAASLRIIPRHPNCSA